ncbi:MAG: hypothetical protein KGO53_09630 [Alphaproteobacteria bacterium]|nr:hypothetical protein [Alphaproteobacteria bacterium]
MSKNALTPKALARQKRAAAALKANLQRRKEAARGETAPEPPESPEDQAKRKA